MLRYWKRKLVKNVPNCVLCARLKPLSLWGCHPSVLRNPSKSARTQQRSATGNYGRGSPKTKQTDPERVSILGNPGGMKLRLGHRGVFVEGAGHRHPTSCSNLSHSNDLSLSSYLLIGSSAIGYSIVPKVCDSNSSLVLYIDAASVRPSFIHCSPPPSATPPSHVRVRI